MKDTRLLVQRAALLLTGNELLSGKVQDRNLIELARTLQVLGVRLERALTIADDRQQIADEVRRMSEHYDVVFTSGGIGPTHDDVTIEAVADAFGVTATLDPTLEALLRKVYQDKLTEGHRRLALVPQGARILTAHDVTWPTIVMHNVWILPGVPELFRTKLMLLRHHLRGDAPYYTRAAYTKMDEGDLKPLLDRVVAEFGHVSVGSYPKWFDDTYKTKVTCDGTSPKDVEAAFHRLLELLPPGEPVRVE